MRDCIRSTNCAAAPDSQIRLDLFIKPHGFPIISLIINLIISVYRKFYTYVIPRRIRIVKHGGMESEK